MTEDSIELRNIDPDDISEVLGKIEKSFAFTFEKGDLASTKTFGDLSDLVLKKVGDVYSNDCTTQQAFYKIRGALLSTLKVRKETITPLTTLAELFPDKNRRIKIKEFENALGFCTDILEIKEWQKWLLFLGVCVSLTMFFIKLEWALAGLCIFLLLGWIIQKLFATELKNQHVGELASKLTKEKYAAVRRTAFTVNKDEVIQTVRQLFSEELLLDETKLTPASSFS